MYQQKIANVEAMNEVYKEDVDSKNHFHLRNKHILSKVTATNRMLTAGMEALAISGGGGGQQLDNSASLVRSGSADGFRSGGLPPMEGAVSAYLLTDPQTQAVVTRPSSTAPGSPMRDSTPSGGGKPAGVAGSTGPLEKLRESLLRVTREHGKSTKQGSNLEREVRSLKRSLKENITLNRQLKSELDELKSVRSGDDNGQALFNPAAKTTTAVGETADSSKPSSSGSDKAVEQVITVQYRPRLRNFGKMDDRFTALLKRDALEPLEGIKIMRRVLQFMASAPPATSALYCANYIVGRDMSKIFDSEIASMHLMGNSMNECYKTEAMRKFTSRTAEPEELLARDYRCANGLANGTTSVAWETIRTGHVNRLNSLSGRTSTHFHKMVDGIPGILAKRMLCMPLRNVNSNEVIGCLSLINKCNPSDAFTEADELMCLLLCDQVSALLTQCFMHERALSAANVYRATMESAVTLYNVIPPHDAITAERMFTPGALLNEMEEVARRALKCYKARAFILSKHIPLDDMEPGSLVYSNQSRKTSSGIKDNDNGWISTNTISSIAGRVSTTGDVVTIFADDVRPVGDDGEASKLNPIVDLALDASSKAIVSIPIMDSRGEIYGVIQLVPSAASPPFDIKEKFEHPDEAGNTIYFTQAAQWVGYQLLASFKHLVRLIGHKVHGPVFRPLEFFRREVGRVDLSSVYGGDGASQFDDDDDHSRISLEHVDNPPPLTSTKSTPNEHKLNLAVLAGNTPAELIAAADGRTAQALEEAKLVQEQMTELTKVNEKLKLKIFEFESAPPPAAVVVDDSKEKALSAQVATLSAEKSELLKRLEEVQASSTASGSAPASRPTSVSDATARNPLAGVDTNDDKLRAAEEERIAAISAQKQAEARSAELEAQLSTATAELEAKLSAATATNTALTDQLVRMADESLKGVDMKAAKQAIAKATKLGSQLDQGSVASDEGKDAVEANLRTSPVAVSNSKPVSLPGSAQGSRPQSRERPLSGKPPSTSPPPSSKPGSSGTTGVSTVHVTGTLPADNDSTTSASEWQGAQDDQGNTYYINTVTGVTSWELPVEATGGFTESTDAFVGMTFGDWGQMFDTEGNEYWVNNVSGESVWTLPDDVTNQFTQEEISKRPNSSKVVASAGGYEIEL